MSKLLTCLAIGILAMASCKKSDDSKLIGTWKIMMTADDENNNGLADEDEKDDSSDDNAFYIFKSDHTLEVRIEGVLHHAFNWELKKKDELVFTSADDNGTGKILEQDNDNLTLEVKDDYTFGWVYLKKQ